MYTPLNTVCNHMRVRCIAQRGRSALVIVRGTQGGLSHLLWCLKHGERGALASVTDNRKCDIQREQHSSVSFADDTIRRISQGSGEAKGKRVVGCLR